MKNILVFLLLFYLGIELSLNAAILDLLSPNTHFASVEYIKRVSGYMGGVGIGLIVAQVAMVMRWLPEKITFAALNFVLCIIVSCALLVGQIQTRLVDHFITTASVSERKDAVVLVAATYALMSGVYKVSNLNLSSNLSDDPTSRTAIILFSPFIVWGNGLPDLEIRIRQIVKNTLFQRSVELQPAFENAITTTCQTFNDAFSEYSKLASDVRRRWAPDRFAEVYKRKRDDYLGYGASLPLGLTREEFVRHPEFQYYTRFKIFTAVSRHQMSSQMSSLIPQDMILNGLNHIFARKILDPCMSWITFRREYIGGVINYVDGLIGGETGQGGLEVLADGGRFEQVGRGGVLAAIGPPLAFCWFLLASVIGSLRVVVWFSSGVLRQGSIVTTTCFLAFLGGICYFPFLADNAIVDSPAFQARASEMQKKVGVVPYFTLEWVLRTAPLVYPLTSALRDSGPGLVLGLSRR